MTSSNRPLWPLLTAALIGLPVLYVASFGPACWISTRISRRAPFVNFVYQPLMRAWWQHGAANGNDLLFRYGCLFTSPDGNFSSVKNMGTGIATYSFERSR